MWHYKSIVHLFSSLSRKWPIDLYFDIAGGKHKRKSTDKSAGESAAKKVNIWTLAVTWKWHKERETCNQYLGNEGFCEAYETHVL